MFQFPWLPPRTLMHSLRWFRYGYLGMTPGGLPHSGIRGSMPADGSPRLNAAFHALHRLVAPRHPPCALISSAPRNTPCRANRIELDQFVYPIIQRSPLQRPTPKELNPSLTRGMTDMSTHMLLLRFVARSTGAVGCPEIHSATDLPTDRRLSRLMASDRPIQYRSIRIYEPRGP